MAVEYLILKEKKFVSRVVKETAYGLVSDFGEQANIMRLIRSNDRLYIEWIVGDEKEPEATAEIGITTVGKSVTDYDGVFEMPKEALELLQDYGFDVKEVED